MVVNNKEINLSTWFVERRIVEFCPKHFVRANTTVTPKSERWIVENLVGRFHIEHLPVDNSIALLKMVPAFEDPAEAILYELTWS